MKTGLSVVLALGVLEAGCNFVLGDRRVLNQPDGATVDAVGPPLRDVAVQGDDGTPDALGDDGPVEPDAPVDADAPEISVADARDDALDVEASACTGSFDGGSAALQAVALSVGKTQACAVMNDAPNSPENATVRCWGSNDRGQLGRDPACLLWSSKPRPVLGRSVSFPELSGIGGLTLSDGYSCAVTPVASGGFVYCWGTLPTVPGVTREQDSPAYLPSVMSLFGGRLDQVSMASVGRLGGCAVKTDSSLLCWGGLLAPEVVALGDAGFVSAGEGGMVSVADQFTAVAVGRTHACGIATHFGVRDVQCWGENKQGQVGFEGASPVTHPYMVGINAYGNVTEIAVGGDQSCARVDTGSVYCWGAEYVRQTDGSASGGLHKVNLLGGAMEIAVGDFHACAVMNDRTVECWGDNSVAQLGGGHAGAAQGPSVVVRRTLAGQLTPLLTVDHIAAGGRTTCAKLVTDTRIHCWGANDYGQAGQPASSAPVAYASLISW